MFKLLDGGGKQAAWWWSLEESKLLDGGGNQAAWWWKKASCMRWRKASCLMVEESKLLDGGGKQAAWWWRKASCLMVEESKLLDGGGKFWFVAYNSTHAWNKNIRCWCCIISQCASLLSTTFHSSSVFSLKHSTITASLSCWIALPSFSAVLRISKNSNSCRRKSNRLHDELFPNLPTGPN